MSKKRKVESFDISKSTIKKANNSSKSFLDKNKLNCYLEKNNHNEIKQYLSYDLQNMVFNRILKIKLLQKKVHELWLEEHNLIECDGCGRIWDGNAQCDCWLYN